MWKGGFQLVDYFVLFFALRLYRAVKSDFYPYCIYFGRKIAKTVVINSLIMSSTLWGCDTD